MRCETIPRQWGIDETLLLSYWTPEIRLQKGIEVSCSRLFLATAGLSRNAVTRCKTAFPPLYAQHHNGNSSLPTTRHSLFCSLPALSTVNSRVCHASRSTLLVFGTQVRSCSCLLRTHSSEVVHIIKSTRTAPTSCTLCCVPGPETAPRSVQVLLIATQASHSITAAQRLSSAFSLTAQQLQGGAEQQ